MSSYANQLVDSSNCLDDYKAGNPIVIKAYNGFLAYELVFGATCLKDGTTANDYCFADAVTNVSSPTSSYVYYLPVGVALSAGATPTCNTCLKTAMSQFAAYATNGTLPISKTYVSAAQQINLVCGPGFVDASVAVTTPTSAAARGQLYSFGLWTPTILMMLMVVW